MKKKLTLLFESVLLNLTFTLVNYSFVTDRSNGLPEILVLFLIGTALYYFFKQQGQDGPFSFRWTAGRKLWLLHFSTYLALQFAYFIPYNISRGSYSGEWYDVVEFNSIQYSVPGSINYERLLLMFFGAVATYAVLFVLLVFFGKAIEKPKSEDD